MWRRALVLLAAVVSVSLVPQRRADATTVAPGLDVREVLAAGRGAPPLLCALAARGAINGGWLHAPSMPLGNAGLDDWRIEHERKLAADSARALVAALGSPDACERQLAAVLIGRAGEGYAGDVAARLTSTVAGERAASLVALGILQDAKTADAIVRVLRDPSSDVRANAAWALGLMEASAHAKAVEGLLVDAVPLVRQAALGALGHMESKAAVGTIARVLRSDEDAGVRRTAAWALGTIEDRSASKALGDALADSDDAVREMAAWALGNLEDASATAALSRALHSDASADVREMAAWALANTEDKAAVSALTDALGDKDSSVRETAAWGLGQMEHQLAPMALVKALGDGESDVRLTAAWALSEIGDEGTAQALRDALRKETVDDVREVLIRGLVQTDGLDNAMVEDLLKSKDPEMRSLAIRAAAGRTGPWPMPMPRPRPRPFP